MTVLRLLRPHAISVYRQLEGCTSSGPLLLGGHINLVPTLLEGHRNSVPRLLRDHENSIPRLLGPYQFSPRLLEGQNTSIPRLWKGHNNSVPQLIQGHDKSFPRYQRPDKYSQYIYKKVMKINTPTLAATFNIFWTSIYEAVRSQGLRSNVGGVMSFYSWTGYQNIDYVNMLPRRNVCRFLYHTST
jgi:hypothetical protein